MWALDGGWQKHDWTLVQRASYIFIFAIGEDF